MILLLNQHVSLTSRALSHKIAGSFVAGRSPSGFINTIAGSHAPTSSESGATSLA
jgi:hypothetical protein